MRLTEIIVSIIIIINFTIFSNNFSKDLLYQASQDNKALNDILMIYSLNNILLDNYQLLNTNCINSINNNSNICPKFIKNYLNNINNNINLKLNCTNNCSFINQSHWYINKNLCKSNSCFQIKLAILP